MNLLFGGTIDLLRQAVSFSTRRHQVLAQNLANAETPGYRGQDIVFRDELETALRGKAAPVSAALFEADGSVFHLPPGLRPPGVDLPPGLRPPTLRTVQVYSGDAGPRMDGNDVDLDRQMVRMAQNTLYHNAMVQILTQQFNGLKGAISGRV